MMQKTMLNLNLQPHICGAIKGKTKRLWSAADIEGHLGLDGKVSLPFLFFLLVFINFSSLCSFICLTLAEQCLLVDQTRLLSMATCINCFEGSLFHLTLLLFVPTHTVDLSPTTHIRFFPFLFLFSFFLFYPLLFNFLFFSSSSLHLFDSEMIDLCPGGLQSRN